MKMMMDGRNISAILTINFLLLFLLDLESEFGNDI